MDSIEQSLICPPSQSIARRSLAYASIIIALWALNLVIALTYNHSNSWSIIVQAWVQSILFVGLFVTAHDSMHGLIDPYSKKANILIGRICCFLFAGFKFSFLKENHLKHHLIPAQPGDPDYTTRDKEQFFSWLGSFMKHYFSLREFLVLHLHVALVFIIGGYEVWKIFVFFAIPSWIASLQLFYFGTYLPHKSFNQKQNDLHNSRSNNFNSFFSFITCFHFGYHYEHHTYPYLAWWRLPKAYKLSNKTIIDKTL